MWQFMICTAHQILLSYQIKEDKISKARGTRHERNINEFWLVKPTGLRPLGQLCMEGRMEGHGLNSSHSGMGQVVGLVNTALVT